MVERYQPTVANVTAVAYCGVHPEGQYVKVADYDALAARLAEVAAVVRDWQTGVESSNGAMVALCRIVSKADSASTGEIDGHG